MFWSGVDGAISVVTNLVESLGKIGCAPAFVLSLAFFCGLYLRIDDRPVGGDYIMIIHDLGAAPYEATNGGVAETFPRCDIAVAVALVL